MSCQNSCCPLPPHTPADHLCPHVLRERQPSPDAALSQILHRPIGETTDASRSLVFTRQLWQRTMPTESNPHTLLVSNNPQHPSRTKEQRFAVQANTISGQRSPSLDRHRHSLGRTENGTAAPLKPEQPQQARRTSAAFDIRDDKDNNPTKSTESAPAEICSCPADQKIPRPPNAFILYRQAKQAGVVQEFPGLPNPEISKIIGGKWQNEPPEVKDKWKKLADEEKVRHQELYPTYRYRPKRSSRRDSQTSEVNTQIEQRTNCRKCGGRNLAGSPSPGFAEPLHSDGSVSSSQSSQSAYLPVGFKSFPALRELTLNSPTTLPFSATSHRTHNMAFRPVADDHRDNTAISPASKRRRFEGETPAIVKRSAQSRYSGEMSGPVTARTHEPPPSGQQQQQTQLPWPAAPQQRRDSLPSFKEVAVGGSVPPPPHPRAVIGYQQHRIANGRPAYGASYQLPPIQTGNMASAKTTASFARMTNPMSSAKTPAEQIKALDFRQKIKVLSQIAHAAPTGYRGPLVAVEGDSPQAAKELATLICQMLRRSDDDLNPSLFEGPELDTRPGSKEEIMTRCHRLAGDWLMKTPSIIRGLAIRKEPQIGPTAQTTPRTSGWVLPAPSRPSPPVSSRKLDENYNDSDEDEPVSQDQMQLDNSSKPSKQTNNAKTESERGGRHNKTPKDVIVVDDAEDMDVEPASAAVRNERTERSTNPADSSSRPPKIPISIIANYSLYASNSFAMRIPIGGIDPYGPEQHWQWTATQWRGIVGPDLTIYLCDGGDAIPNGAVVMEPVEGKSGIGVFVITKPPKTPQGDSQELEASILRRLGFEVAEWVRAFRGARRHPT